jgi:hypothetical protein
LAILFAFLFLVGLYESWMIPVPVLLSPVGILGAFLGILIGRRPCCRTPTGRAASRCRGRPSPDADGEHVASAVKSEAVGREIKNSKPRRAQEN